MSQIKKIRTNFLEYLSKKIQRPMVNPQSSDLMITSRCNFHCNHCDIWKEPTSDIDFQKWKEIITDLRNWLGPNYPINIAGGEPLIRADCFDIIKLLKLNDFKTTLITNGYFINKKIADRLISNNLYEIRVSLYSFNSEIHDSMRGVKNAHKNAIEALKNLQKAKEKYNSKINICIALLINNLNIKNDALDLINWAYKNNISILLQAIDENFLCKNSQKNWYDKNPFWPKDEKQIVNFFDEVSKLKKSGVKITNTYKTIMLYKNYFLYPKENSQLPCLIAYKPLNFDPSGRIYFCFDTGYLNINKSLKETWHSKEIDVLRSKIKSCKKVCRVHCYYQDNIIDKIKNKLNTY